MEISRTRFAKEIVAEFMPPANKRSKKVMMICHGLPSIPKKNEVLEFFSKQNYWVFFPRYRGTWESGGKFLAKSPEQDIVDVINSLPNGFTDFWTGKRYMLSPTQVHLFGSSFGGAAVMLASKHKLVKKVVAVSPVVDWKEASVTEPLPWLDQFITNAFGNAYRYSKKDWKKLGTSFFNPTDHVDTIDGKKIYIIHAKDDDVVLNPPVEEFANAISAKFFSAKTGGHFSTSLILDSKYQKKILSFLHQRS